jgi:dolichol-phosphate mannosyltransferase
MSKAENNQSKISFVIPVYCNKDSLLVTFLSIKDLLESNFPKLLFEVIFVDDGSLDESWPELKSIFIQHQKQVKLVKLSRNFGQVNAILAGYNFSTGDAVITVSADLQDPINLAGEMISQWMKGQQIVIAYRQSREDSFFSSFLSRIAYKIASISNPKIPVEGFDYFLLSKIAKELLLQFGGSHRFIQGDILWLGLPTTFIPYIRKERLAGKSQWTLSKKLKYFIDLLINASYIPIRTMSLLGLLFALSGIIYSAIIFYNWFYNKTPFQGWSPIIILLLFIGGFIMIMLGIIGEYLWRMYDDIKCKPKYLVENFVDSNADFK